MMHRPILLTALVLTATGCTSIITTQFNELQPSAAAVRAERIAVLPITAEAGSEQMRAVIGDSLLRQAERTHPDVDWLPAAQALDRLNDAGLAERFANLLLAYQNTGLFDRALLREVGTALGADHVLQLRVGYDQRNQVLPRLWFPSETYVSERQEVSVTALLWDVRDGGLAWETSGISITEDGEYSTPRSFAEVVAQTASQLAGKLPIASDPATPASAAAVGGGGDG